MHIIYACLILWTDAHACFSRSSVGTLIDLRQAAMTKMKPGQRLGMAEAIDGEVRAKPSIMMTWYIDTLHNIGRNLKLV